jgi:hypothetical protein
MHRSGIRGTDLLSAAHAARGTRTVGIRLACVASCTGNCGPTFAVPNWTDAGGWTDPSFGRTSEAGKGSAT